MKTAAVLVCLALLVAIACSAPVDNPGVQKRSLEGQARAHPHAAEMKAAHELRSLGEKVKADHAVIHNSKFRKEAQRDLGLVKKAAGQMSDAQRKKAAHKVAKKIGGKRAKALMRKLQ
ncbi:uncharacterized protein LOC144886068 [Branchiostoma floridae x Branchiostoma japonicum]